MQSKIITTCFLFLAATVLARCATVPAIIPLPQKMELRDGVFQITVETRVYLDSGSRGTGKFLTERLRAATGYPLPTSIKHFGSAAIPGAIFLTTKGADTNLGPEGYDLTVVSNSVVIRAPSQAGLFYGVQSLFQLLPPEVYSSN